MSGAGRGRDPRPLRKALNDAVLGTMLLAAGCGRSETSRLPTAPSLRSGEAWRADETPIPRMAITRAARVISRQRTPTPLAATQTPTPTVPTATAAPADTPTPTVTASRSPGPPTSTATPTPALPTPTGSPTPAPIIVIRLRGISWQWDFYGPGVTGGATISLRIGETYELHIFNDAPPDASSHTFSGIPALGIAGRQIVPGDPEYVYPRFTPTAAGTFPFLCTDSSCGIGHSDMVGSVQVVP